MAEPKWDAQVVYERQESYDMAAGPYGYEKVGVRFNDRVIWLGLRGYGVPEHMASEWSDAVRLANLLAAAPDLYDALQRLVETFEQIVPLNPDQVDYDAYKRAIDALRKARGEDA